MPAKKKLSRSKKSLRLADLMHEIRDKHLSRRWTVRLGAVVLLMIGVYMVVNRASDEAPAAASNAAPAKITVAAKPPAAMPATAAPTTRLTAGTSATRPADKRVLAKSDTVTITGCLEQDDETFRLKDTDGEAAPKSRSWKTGFVTKRKATVALAASVPSVLQTHVGQRVSVTGLLVEREMQVQSLRRVAASCAGA